MPTNSTSFLEAQRRAGAQFDAAVSVARDFGNALSEHAAAGEDCAVFDMSLRSQLEMTGADRAKFLHNFCTNNIKALQPHEGCEAFCTNVKGRIVGHIFVFCDQQSLWIESVAGADESLVAHLDRYIITEDVQLHSRTAEFGELLVSGPKSVERLAAAEFDVGELKPCGHGMAHVGPIPQPVVVRRVDWLLQPGFLLSVSRNHLADLWELLVSHGARPAGATAFEVLRIEAQFPLFGIDISDDNLAQEVGRTAQAISFTKGCYLGQEPIARIDAMGHVNRELCGLRQEAGPLPPRGAAVNSPDGKEIGAITSAAQLVADQPPVALAYLRSNFVAPGTHVAVRINDESIPASVLR